MSHSFNKGRRIAITIVKLILGCIISLVSAIKSTEKKIFCLEQEYSVKYVSKFRAGKNHMKNFQKHRFGGSLPETWSQLNVRWILEICI